MKIRDILAPESVIMSLKATNKEDAIQEMADLEVETGIVNNEADFIASIWARENESTTGIGDGIAMPHARNESINKARVLFAKSEQGIDYNSLDGQPVYLFFMIAAPAGADNTHLEALAKLSSLLINPDLVSALKKAKTPEEVIALFEEAEEKTDAAKKAENEKPASDTDQPLIVGVTACINGIAHTYMAQEALIKAGKKRGVEVRIETNGSEGVKDKLTAAEISRAKGVVIASDKKVDMPRFDGKPLVNRPVVDGINKPDEMIDNILNDKASVYHSDGQVSAEEDNTKQSFWGSVYKNLMNGVSHMLPFVIGGGILMAISFIIENYAGGPKSPAFIFLNNAGNMAFAFMVPILSGYIAESIGDLPALMPGFVGGFMATVYSGAYGGAYVANVVTNAKSPAGFLGGLASGFIAGYLVVGLKKLCAKLPKSLEGMKPMLIYPILGLLLIALIMYYIVNPIFSSINFAITNFLNQMGTGNLVVLTTILAAMMSIDMGGPFNKAAYVFASGAFANDPHSTVAAVMMAAVMVGGMVPAFATAIGTTFFKNKFTEDERRAGITNWILGFSFITEGAIPFAAADAKHVIPSCIVGSAVGGALVGFWRIGVPAPHGGLWVSPLANHILLYFVATIIGSIVAGVILGLWKKPINK
ncbi:PTS system D-fructose-specific IIA component (F1P-forming), Frc family /PTS system D-fructose-specific IIB component (F1P-forming), Frc family /PTS system D-fructose-specific IIC component (F1P-forming), Frc family [Lactobacillus bombicola]|uniref:PTS system D-fructose-specific IIA component (F1P-forming), Frc family /PTS system D-fructose-specific IIB component (F1P-forming), Frc family /PTS system D-fructose-specific IIC component (F1P-for... n=1 Tax=Lactobacillus bombicola TaxID=1505723 RepID=A0A1I1S2J1_9LACO|nr:fructose-specific PTS transporter subunit EIIC [Lactobacillus bombicola]SFD37150.1 PTS system D-fructose-specific IIA component (F1P-forming), Frc family /PTS system D-fructose-specific IIB component (F1P-forming), Frc family /PTS system D-fructose-specific IIC component (F1P-forming), Frc family [Lactobacillus bombicola]